MQEVQQEITSTIRFEGPDAKSLLEPVVTVTSQDGEGRILAHQEEAFKIDDGWKYLLSGDKITDIEALKVTFADDNKSFDIGVQAVKSEPVEPEVEEREPEPEVKPDPEELEVDPEPEPEVEEGI